jgi:hypothetical protein
VAVMGRSAPTFTTNSDNDAHPQTRIFGNVGFNLAAIDGLGCFGVCRPISATASRDVRLSRPRESMKSDRNVR